MVLDTAPDRKEFELRQTRLREIYRESLTVLLPKLREKVEQGRELSCPFLLSLTANNYAEARVRLLIVGQQTNPWEQEWMKKDVGADELVEHLLCVYSDFRLGYKYRRTPIVQTTHRLYRGLNPSGPRTASYGTTLLRLMRLLIAGGRKGWALLIRTWRSC